MSFSTLQSGPSHEHFKELKILYCTSCCPRGVGHQKNTVLCTIRVQDFALAGSTKAAQISNFYIISFGEIQSKLKTSVQCWDRIRTQTVTGLSPAKTLRWPVATQKDVHLACKAWVAEGAQYFGLSLGKRRHSPVPNCFHKDPRASKKEKHYRKGKSTS